MNDAIPYITRFKACSYKVLNDINIENEKKVEK